MNSLEKYFQFYSNFKYKSSIPIRSSHMQGRIINILGTIDFFVEINKKFNILPKLIFYKNVYVFKFCSDI